MDIKLTTTEYLDILSVVNWANEFIKISKEETDEDILDIYKGRLANRLEIYNKSQKK
jgi:hypothetical protein